MKDILRKCTLCDTKGSKTINVDMDKFIYSENRYYHYDCFIKYKVDNNEYNLSHEQIVQSADELVLKTKSYKKVRESIDKDRLTYWLYDNYNISVLPSVFFTKLQKINDGTFSNRINTPISCYELLQIFKKMKTYLDKVNNKNERAGKIMSSSQRVNYDLSIVLNNYDEYVKWKQKQKVEIVEKQQLQDEIKCKNNINSNNISTIQRNSTNIQSKGNEEINIADLLDEVF